MRLVVAVLFLSAVACAKASQDDLPNEVDLKASYCAAVIQRWLVAERRMNAPGAGTLLIEHERSLQRVQSYLLPRIAKLDANGFLLAYNQGSRDYESGLQEAAACVARCTQNQAVCTFKCSANEFFDRTDKCRTLDFVPF